MADSFIIYTPNPPSISTLTSSGKKGEWAKIKKNLEEILENYKKNDYEHQELKFFDIIDKTFEEMTHSHFAKIVKKIMEKIKEEKKENNIKTEPISFNRSDKSVFNLSFRNILSLVNVIMYLIDNNTSKNKSSDTVYDFAYKDKIPPYKDVLINKQQLSKLLSDLDSVKTLKIKLYEERDDIHLNHGNKKNNIKNKNVLCRMDSKIVFFFSLFFKTIFKSINSVSIDLNIPQIDNYFLNNSNPYLINEESILKLADDYKDVIISNLILIKALPRFIYLTNLDFVMYDSYQVELHNILTFLLDNQNINDVENKQKFNGLKIIDQAINSAKDNLSELKENQMIFSKKFKNNYLYIQHLLTAPETSYYDFCFHFNSLDPLLFNSVNILLIKFTCIAQLKIILFPNKTINKRKLCINNCFYNKYSNNDEESSYFYSSEDKKIYYQYLDNNYNNSNNFILKDEKLLNELFYSFNMNLRSLSIILEKKINDLLTLSLDFSTYNNESITICNYDNYNCSIICFIFDLFRTFQLNIDSCKINSLEIFYDDFLDEKAYVVETVKLKIPSCKNGFKLNKLKLNHINFNISNISLIIPFENFPSIYLTELIISNLSYNDLNNLVNALNNNKDLFPVLIKLDLSFGIMVEDYNRPLELLLKKCLPSKLIYFNLNLPFNISITQLVDILYWIKCNHNVDIIINIKIFHSQLSQCINDYYFKNGVSDLINSSKDYFKKRNILPKYEITKENTIKFIINKYNNKDIDYYYKFIFCFEKNISLNINNNSNKKIYENIFNYRGKFKEYEINVEVIN